jgi:hypothetical protein
MSRRPHWFPLLHGFGVLAWAAAAQAQRADTDADPPRPHPVFGVATVGGELGGNYAAGAKLALFATPSAAISLGGSGFFAPITSLQDECVSTCDLHPLLFRGMAELRLGNPYTEYARGLAWLGFGAGVEYLAEPRLAPSPSAALSGGGDILLTPSLWLELAIRLNWAQLIGPSSPFAGTYFTFGVEVGVRFDFAH